MKFEPLSDEETQAPTAGRKPLCDGFADFLVKEATETTSSAGNDMIKLMLLIRDEHGGSGVIYDHLTFIPKAHWKIKQFLGGIGQESHYKKGELHAEFCQGATGKCRIKQKVGTEWFEIAEYIKTSEPGFVVKSVANKTDPNKNPFEDDDEELPF